MRTVIEQLILDFQNNPARPGVRRDVEVAGIPETVSTVTGARRSGKSYLMRQLIQDWLNAGNRKPNQVCYLDFDNEKIAYLQKDELGLIDTAMLALHSEFGENVPLLFVFDEIHRVEGWELFVVRLSRNPRWNVVVTGSSARLLRYEVSTELRGKSIVTELAPFSFREFLRMKNVDADDRSTLGIVRLKKAFDEYIRQGGFPAAIPLDGILHVTLLQEYFHTMISRDIIELNNLSQPQAWIRLLHQLFVQNACPMTKKSSYEFIRSCGFIVGREKVVEFLNHARDAYVVDFVEIYSNSIKQREQNYKKVYAVDWGLVQANIPAGEARSGRHLENVVFMELKRRGKKVDYALTRDGQEVDFIVSDMRGNLQNVIQVSFSLSKDPRTFSREINALVKIAQHLGRKEAYLLTYDEEKEIQEANIPIHVSPVWRWLLK